MQAIQSNYDMTSDTITSRENSPIKINHYSIDIWNNSYYSDIIPNISLTAEIPIISEVGDLTSETITTFKKVLLERFKQLDDIIDFLKNELEEKNLHIRTMTLKEANDGGKYRSDVTLSVIAQS